MKGKKNTVDYDKIYTTEEDIQKMYTEIEEASSPEAIRKARSKRVFFIAKRALVAFVILAVCLVLIEVRVMRDRGESPSVFGYSVYNVLTGSMTPTLPVDSVFLAKQYNGQELNVGDIVVFQDAEGTKIITHRIVEKGTDEQGKTFYRTKGDNPKNSVDNDPLYEENIEAVFVMRLYLF